MDSLIAVLISSVSDLGTSLMGAIGGAAPVLMPVFGGLIAIGIILKVVRRVTGR